MKNKILAFLLVLAMCLSMLPMSVFAADNSTDLIITGGTEGTDYTYENGVLDIKAAGTYEIKNVDPATATGDIIKVSAPSGTVNITLNGVVINVSGTGGYGPEGSAAFEITGECTTKLILKDGSENSLDSGVDRAGIANHSHNLIITCENAENATHICSSDCGALRAVGQNEAAGIGGDTRESGSNITITGGNIVADIVGSRGGAGIGGGNGRNGSNITISGGTVTATSVNGAGIGGGFHGSGNNITISGGTVTATSVNGAGIGGSEGDDGSNITISGGTVTATSVYGAGIGGGANGGIAENIKIAPAANTRIYAYNGSDNTGTALAGSPFTTETDITSLLSGNAFYSYTETDLIITGGTEGTDYTYENGVLDIKAAGRYEIKNADPTTATGDIIKVSAPSRAAVSITLSGVNIDVSNTGDSTAGTDGLCAFDIVANCTTNIILANETTNILKSGAHMAGLQNRTYPLIISCMRGARHECNSDCGAIEVYGGRTAAGIGGRGGWEEDRTDGSNITVNSGNITATGDAAGIGGADNKAGTDIVINGGNVIATSEWDGAGIGGGEGGGIGSRITISGGTVTATSARKGAGIGGGSYGKGDYITISGGTVTATGTANGAGIGGGEGTIGILITISGGTVTATSVHGAGIGGGRFSGGDSITISGGTVTATSVHGAGIGGGEGGNGSNIKIAPAANTEIEVNTGANATEAEELTYAFAKETDITELVRGNAYFHSETTEHSHNGGTATCTDKAVCTDCGTAYGEVNPDAHDWGEWQHDDNPKCHTRRCKRDERNHVEFEDHFGGTPTCIESATCTVCGGSYKDGFNHADYGTSDWLVFNDAQMKEKYHYRICLGCGNNESVAEHIGGTATCKDKAVCTDCGSSYGETNPQNHTGGTATCTERAICTDCGTAYGDLAEHTYGDATCEAPATCSECGEETGDALGHKDDNTDHTCDRGCGKTDMGTHGDTDTDHACDYGCAVAIGTHAAASGKRTCDYCGAAMSNCKDDDENHICDICGAEFTHEYSAEWKSDGTNHWHECTCGAKGDEAAHSGGTATYTEKAKCVVCAEEYGELAAHTYGTEWKSDGTNHWHECSCGAKGDEAAHSGGTATCTVKAACTACGVAYGELAAHTYKDGKCTVCEAVDPDYVPESSSPQTGDNSNMALWIALLFISGGAVITLTAYDRKRRRNTV